MRICEKTHPLDVRTAIEKIGSQYLYWRAFADEVIANRLGYAPDTRRDVLEVGSGGVRVNRDETKTVRVAEGHGKTPEYNGFIPLTNLIGDGDFWGSYGKKIFPLNVWVSEGGHDDNVQVEVTSERLGISDAAAQAAWDSWNNVSTQLGIIHTEAVTNLCDEQKFVPFIQSAIVDALKSGEDLSQPYKITRKMHYLFYKIPDSEKNQILPPKLAFEQMLKVAQDLVGEDALERREDLSQPYKITRQMWELYDDIPNREKNLIQLSELVFEQMLIATEVLVGERIAQNVKTGNTTATLREASEALAVNLHTMWQSAQALYSIQ